MFEAWAPFPGSKQSQPVRWVMQTDTGKRRKGKKQFRTKSKIGLRWKPRKSLYQAIQRSLSGVTLLICPSLGQRTISFFVASTHWVWIALQKTAWPKICDCLHLGQPLERTGSQTLSTATEIDNFHPH